MVSLLALRAQDWSAGGHAEPAAWYRTFGLIGPWVALAALAFLIARSLLHARRYRARAVLGDAEQERVRSAIRAAERRTVGEVVPVVVERSDPHPSAEWLAALGFLLAGSAALLPHLPWRAPFAFLLTQLAFGALGFALARALPGFKRLFVFESRASAVANEQAFQEFYANGLHRTQGATGVLIFVSLLERRVVVMADEGIAARVAPEAWKEVDELALAGIRRGSLAEGLESAVARAGELLAAHCPWGEGDRNELPDRLIVRGQ
jgi:putative membrane protein